MFTFLFIIFMIYIIVKACSKDKHNKAEDSLKLSQLPSFVVRAKRMSSFSKFLNLAYDNSSILKRFSYSQQTVEITLENGTSFTAKLEEMSVTFQKSPGTVIYYIAAHGKKINFYQTTNITNKEWDAITALLCLAGETYGRDQFSKAVKYSGYLASAMKAIKYIS